jgi:crossover junction endodeoxyribonuclease RuvC
MMRTSLKPNLIVGIDPGTRITGFGVITSAHGKINVVDYGCIRSKPHFEPAQIYENIYLGVCELLEKYPATAVAIELQFVDKNVQSALKLGMARGVALLAAALRKIPVFEYTPADVKKAVVGNGRASKEQVQKMIKLLCGLSTIPEPEDAADGLAIAIRHAYTKRELTYV